MPSKGKGKGISGAREAWRALRRGERNPAWIYCVLLPSSFFISIHQRKVKILFGQNYTRPRFSTCTTEGYKGDRRRLRASCNVMNFVTPRWSFNWVLKALQVNKIASILCFSLVAEILFFNRGSVSSTEVNLSKSRAIYLLFTLQLFKSWIALSTG